MARKSRKKPEPRPSPTAILLPAAASTALGAVIVLLVAWTAGDFAAPPAPDGAPASAPAGPSVLPVKVDRAIWPGGVTWRRLVAHYGLEREVLGASLNLNRKPDGSCPSADATVAADTTVTLALTSDPKTNCPVSEPRPMKSVAPEAAR